MKICCLIPARYNSSRLPGKPLLKLGSKTMIQRTYEQCKKSKLINNIYVVTDNKEIKNNVQLINGKVIMVDRECNNGTERICYALKKLENKHDIIVNVQGDEPFINSNHIDLAIKKLIKNIDNDDIVCSTLHYKIINKDELFNKNIGKLVLNNRNEILYCSRNMIPSNKEGKVLDNHNYYGHVGIFVFKKDYLKKFVLENTPLQISEDIEWLKILEQGYKIVSSCISNTEISINTIEDYNYILKKYFYSK